VQALLALGQWQWVLPTMAQQLVDGGIDVSSLGIASAADLDERIARGGTYGTYTLANGLAMHLVIIALALGSSLLVLRRDLAQHMKPLVLGLVLLGLLAVALVTTGAKGAVLAGLLGALWGLFRLSSLPAKLALGLGTVALAVLWFWAGTPFAGHSLSVRFGYWTAAWALVEQAPVLGHGLESYALLAGPYLPLGAEFSRQVHNGYLAMAVAGGLVGVLPLVALLVSWALPARRRQADRIVRKPLILICIPVVLLYGLLLGSMVSDNLAFWPGAAGLGGQVLWTLALGLIAWAVALGALHLPVPGPLARSAAIAALLAGAVIDFHLLEPGLLALALVLVAIGLRCRPQRPRPLTLATLAGAAIALFAAVVWWQGEASRQQERSDSLSLLRSATSKPLDHSEWQLLAWLNRAEAPQDRRSAQALWLLALDRNLQDSLAAPQDRRQALDLIALHPDARQRLAALDDIPAGPGRDARWWAEQARSLNALGKRDEAIEAQRQSVRRLPWHLPARYQLTLLLQAALQRAGGTGHPALEQELAEELETIRSLQNRVYFRDRLSDELFRDLPPAPSPPAQN
jgi:hypothetical protein